MAYSGGMAKPLHGGGGPCPHVQVLCLGRTYAAHHLMSRPMSGLLNSEPDEAVCCNLHWSCSSFISIRL